MECRPVPIGKTLFFFCFGDVALVSSEEVLLRYPTAVAERGK